MQTEQLHVRLTKDELSELESIAAQSETNRTALAASIIRAGIRAAKASGKRLKLPPEFQVIEEHASYRSHDMPRTRVTRK